MLQSVLQRLRSISASFYLSLTITIGSSMLVLMLNHYFGPYSRANNANWEYLLAPNDQLNVGSASSSGSGVSATQQYGLNHLHFLYSKEQFASSLQQVAYIYFNIQDIAVDNYQYTNNSGSTLIEGLENPPTAETDLSIPPMQMSVTSYQGGASVFDISTPYTSQKETKHYNIYANQTSQMMGPFDVSDNSAPSTRSLSVDLIDSVEITFSLQNFALDENARTCFVWKTDVKYDFGTRSRIAMTIDGSSNLCAQEASIPWLRRGLLYELILYIGIALVAGVHQLITSRDVYRAYTKQLQSAAITRRPPHVQTQPSGEYAHVPDRSPSPSDSNENGSQPTYPRRIVVTPAARMNDEHEPLNGTNAQPSDSAPKRASFSHRPIVGRFQALLDVISIWFVISTVSNLCNVAGPMLAFDDHLRLEGSSPLRLYLSGFGCAASWVSLVQYFEGSQSWYVLITTLRRGLPRVARFLVGVLPIFVGYCFFGVTMFSSESDRFGSFDHASVALFSLLNGDVILETFQELYPAFPVASRIYFASFVCLFIYAVLNVLVAILEDSYFASKVAQLTSHRQLADPSDTHSALNGSQRTDGRQQLLNPKHQHDEPVQSFLDMTPSKRDMEELKSPSSRFEYDDDDEHLEVIELAARQHSAMAERYETAAHHAAVRKVSNAADNGTSIISMPYDTLKLTSQLHPPSSQPNGRHDAVAAELLSYLSDVQLNMINQCRQLLSNKTRPSHSPAHYPCHWSSAAVSSEQRCLYCSMRRVYEDSMQEVMSEWKHMMAADGNR